MLQYVSVWKKIMATRREKNVIRNPIIIASYLLWGCHQSTLNLGLQHPLSSTSSWRWLSTAGFTPVWPLQQKHCHLCITLAATVCVHSAVGGHLSHRHDTSVRTGTVSAVSQFNCDAPQWKSVDLPLPRRSRVNSSCTPASAPWWPRRAPSQPSQSSWGGSKRRRTGSSSDTRQSIRPLRTPARALEVASQTSRTPRTTASCPSSETLSGP